jgi:hypothetical protein
MNASNLKWHYYRAGQQDGQTVYCRVTETGREYPWPTYRELHRDCKASGARAVIHDSEAEALAAVGRPFLK